MKKTLLGLLAAAFMFSFAAPARAEGDAAGGDKPADTGAKKEKKAKKGKKAKAGEGGEAGGDTGAAGGAEKK